MSDESPTPGLRGVIEILVEEAMDRVLGPIPGIVRAYDADTQTATVQPLIKRVESGDDGDRVARSRPALQDVPIIFVGGGGGRLTFPITPGDLALIVPCGYSIVKFMTRGGAPAEVDPGTATPSLNDSFAIVGIHTAASIPTTAPNDAVVLHAESPLELRLGSDGADQSVIRGDAFRADLDILLTALGTFANANLGGAAMNAAITTFKAQWSQNLSSKVMVD